MLSPKATFDFFARSLKYQYQPTRTQHTQFFTHNFTIRTDFKIYIMRNTAVS